MSGWVDDNPDDARRETTTDHRESLSERADVGAGSQDHGSQRAAVLSDQGPEPSTGLKEL